MLENYLSPFIGKTSDAFERFNIIEWNPIDHARIRSGYELPMDCPGQPVPLPVKQLENVIATNVSNIQNTTSFFINTSFTLVYKYT